MVRPPRPKWTRSELDDLLLLRGGDHSLSYTMAVLCSQELRQGRNHVAWGGESEYLAMKDDLLWLPSTVEMWVFFLEAWPLETFEVATEFEWRRVWEAEKPHSATVAIRVTSHQDLLRLESSLPLLKLVQCTVRIFAFKKDQSAAFATLKLSEESQRMLWTSHLDDKEIDALELNVAKRDWMYTVVGDDSDPLNTGDPIFCFRGEHATMFADHFEAVGARHNLRVHTGILTQETLRKLRLPHEG